MIKDDKKYIIFNIMIVCMFCTYLYISKHNKSDKQNIKIDTIYKDSKRDSINRKIDTVYSRIKTFKTKHDETIDSIYKLTDDNNVKLFKQLCTEPN